MIMGGSSYDDQPYDPALKVLVERGEAIIEELRNTLAATQRWIEHIKALSTKETP